MLITPWRLLGSLLIAYTILLRLLYLGVIELLQEEAYYWNYSQHMAAGYLDHPSMVALLIRFGTLLFGTTEAGVRFGAFLCWFITAFFVYRFARTMLDREAAFGSLILVAVLPVFFGIALVMTPDAPLLACSAASLYHLYRALLQEQRRDWTCLKIHHRFYRPGNYPVHAAGFLFAEMVPQAAATSRRLACLGSFLTCRLVELPA